MENKTNKTKYITKDMARTMLENLPSNETPDNFMRAMLSKGYTFEGLDKTQPKKELGFLDKLKSDLGERVSNISEEIQRPTATPEPGRKGLRVLGQVGGGVLDVVNTATEPVMEKVVNPIANPINQALDVGMEKVNQLTGGTEPIPTGEQATEYAIGKYQELPEDQRKDAEAIGNIINTVLLGKVGSKGASKIKDSIKLPDIKTPSGKAFVEGISTKAASLGLSPETAGKVVKSYISNTSGVSPVSQEFIATTAKAGKFDEMFNNDILANPRPTEMKVLQDVATKLDEVVGEKGVIGSGYKGVLDNAPAFKFSRQQLINDVVDSTKLKYDIKKGFYKTADTADIAQGDLIKLNNLLDTYKGVKTLDGNQFKVLRNAIKDLAYDNGLKSASGERIAKNLYEKVNTNYRENVPGLKELDAKFADAIDQIDEIKGFFTKDSQGNLVLKDNAERQLSALLERGNERKLATVKQFVPDIEERIAYANTLRNLDAAQGNLVGNYGKTGGNIMAGAVGTAIGGPIGGIAAFLANLIASNPNNVAKAIGRFYRSTEDLSSASMKKAPAINKKTANVIDSNATTE